MGETAAPPSHAERWSVLLAALLLNALLIVSAGRLGFHFEDLSIPFDGGYRIALGQEPFVDFVAPIGPVLFLQQGLLFALFGVSHGTYLLHAVLLGTLATWVVWWMCRRWGRVPALVGAGGTLAWFYLPPAAPYIDTTAFFWTLVALAMLWPSLLKTGEDGDTGPPPGLLVLAGLCAGLAFLTKQNIGGLAIAGLGLLLLLVHRQLRPPILFGLATAVPLALLSGYAAMRGGWDLYLEYFWQVPLESGRLKYIIPWGGRMVIKLLRPEAVNSTYAFMAGKALRELVVYGLCALLAWRAWRATPRRRPPLLVAAFLLLVQQWSYNTSNNDEVLYWPFAGLVVVLVLRAFWPAARPMILTAATLLLVAGGVTVGFGRTVHSLKPSNLGPALEQPRLSGLRLYPREGQELATLLEALDQRVPAEEGVFVLGHSTLIYGAADRPPPQPLLWFRAGVSYSADDSSATDALIVRSLERQNVRWIVLDPVGSDELLLDFPGIARLAEERFREVELELGSYRLLRRVD